jgi:hypothetical protein
MRDGARPMINTKKVKLALGIFVILLASLACQLTSPTPASWSGTPTARVLNATNTAVARTLQAGLGDVTPLPPTVTPTKKPGTPTPQETQVLDGPWLIYPAPNDEGLHAFDVDTETTLTIDLPKPMVIADLQTGLSPQGDRLVIRAGSPLNTDELALYQIVLPSLQVTKLTPLLSLTLQRRIVNQIGTLAFDILEVVTRSDSLAWSPDGRFLAFTAALDNESSDLYVLDTLNNRIDRLNGLSSHAATPFWALNSTSLVSQELGRVGEAWRAEAVYSLSVPGFGDQNVLYLPDQGAQEEIFLGWINADTFISYSNSDDGNRKLQQVGTNPIKIESIFEAYFKEAAFDQLTQVLAFNLGEKEAAPQGLVAGIYIVQPNQLGYRLQRAGYWDGLVWDPGGFFVVQGAQGVYTFSAQEQDVFLPDEANVRISSDGQWLIGWGNGIETMAGARLYQPPNTNPLQTISEKTVGAVLWQPDSRGFFIFIEGELYHVEFPSLKLNPVQIGFPDSGSFDLIWVD